MGATGFNRLAASSLAAKQRNWFNRRGKCSAGRWSRTFAAGIAAAYRKSMNWWPNNPKRRNCCPCRPCWSSRQPSRSQRKSPEFSSLFSPEKCAVSMRGIQWTGGNRHGSKCAFAKCGQSRITHLSDRALESEKDVRRRRIGSKDRNPEFFYKNIRFPNFAWNRGKIAARQIPAGHRSFRAESL